MNSKINEKDLSALYEGDGILRMKVIGAGERGSRLVRSLPAVNLAHIERYTVADEGVPMLCRISDAGDSSTDLPDGLALTAANVDQLQSALSFGGMLVVVADPADDDAYAQFTRLVGAARGKVQLNIGVFTADPRADAAGRIAAARAQPDASFVFRHENFDETRKKLLQLLQSLCSLLHDPGYVGFDFIDISRFFADAADCSFGAGCGTAASNLKDVAQEAIADLQRHCSPKKKAQGLMMAITVSADIEPDLGAAEAADVAGMLAYDAVFGKADGEFLWMYQINSESQNTMRVALMTR